MDDSHSGKKWEVSLGPESLVHVHYTTASTEVISDGFEGLARELRDVEFIHRAGAAAAPNHVVPVAFPPDTEGRDDTDAGNRNA